MNGTALPVDLSAMQTTLRDYRKSLGKETQSYHYMNEVRLLRHALSGDVKTSFHLKTMTGVENWLARRVICYNRRLIRAHVSYKLRKQACRQLVLKYESKR